MAAAFNLTAQLNLRGPNNVNKIVSDIRRQLGTVKGEIDFKINATAAKNVTQLNAAIKNLNSSLLETRSNAVAATTAISAFTNVASSINNTASKTATNISKASVAVNNLSSSSKKAKDDLSETRTEMEEFGRQSALAIRRFAAFTGVTSVIFGLSNAFKQAFGAFVEFDKAFIKLQQVTDKSGAELQSLSKEVTSLSVGLGIASSDLIDVAQTLAQAGLSAKDTEKALRALALSDLAPSFDSMNDTVEGSIALMRQFGISAGELEKVLGSVNAVAAGFAVEASDIIAAIQRTGGVFAAASKGVSEGSDALNEFIAVFTSVRATTRESAETIATGLRTIFTRIQREGTIEALREFGVTLTDAEGKFVGAYKAVQLLSEGLSRLDPRDIRFSQIVEELGGFRQIGKVIPLIQQFATAQEALKVAQAGQGSLASDAIKAQLSLANQISKVREEFLAFVRDIGGSDTFQTLAKTTLGFASGLIKVASALKGVLPVLAILGLGKAGSALTQFGSGFIGGLKKTKPDSAIQSQTGSSSVLGSRSASSSSRNQSIDFSQINNSLNSLGNTIDSLISSLNSLNGLSSELTNNTASLIANTASIESLTQAISSMNLGGSSTLSNGGKVLGFNKGGIVPGSGRGDKVPAMLEPGEVVMSNQAVQKYGRSNLNRMNRFAGGGKVIIDYPEEEAIRTQSIDSSLATAINSVGSQLYPKTKKIKGTTAQSMPNYAGVVGSIFEAGLARASEEPFKDDRKFFDFPKGIDNVKTYSSLTGITSDAKRNFDKNKPFYVNNILNKIGNTLGDNINSSAQNFGVAVMNKGEDTTFDWTADMVKNAQIDKKYLGGKIQKFMAGSPGGVRVGSGKGRGKTGAKGARDIIEPISSETYLRWAKGIYDEYDADPSLVMSIDELGARLPPEIALANRLLSQYALETGGAGLKVGQRFVRTPKELITEDLKPYLIPDPNDSSELGFYEDIIARIGKAKAKSAAATAKLGKQAALGAASSRIASYENAENAISEFKQSGILNIDPNIMSYISSSIANPTSLPLPKNIITSIQSKLTPTNLEAFKALTGKDRIPVKVQGQRTKLSEVFNTILETYGSDVSDLEIDSIIRGVGSKMMNKSTGGLIQKFMAGSTGSGGVQSQTDPIAQDILDKLQQVGGAGRARQLLTLPAIEKAIAKVQTSGKRPRSASGVFDKPFLTSSDATPFLSTLSSLADQAITLYSGTSAADFDLTPEQIAAARDVAIAGLRTDMKDLAPYYRLRKGFPLRVHTGIVSPDKYSIIDKLLEQQHMAQVEAARALAPNETISPLSKEDRQKFGEDNLGGYNLEALLALFGSGNGKKTTQDAIDFASGLTPLAASIFGVPAGIPTQAKLTVSSSNVTKALDGIIKTFALGGLAEATEEMSGLMKNLYGNRSSEDKPAQKKEKQFGKIALRNDGSTITATYFKQGAQALLSGSEMRSGQVTASKIDSNLYAVGLSAATKGYGPRLYDAVMEAATENGGMLTSDRNTVSGDAKKVWEYYFKNRGDVKKTPLKPSNWTKNQANIDPKLYGNEDTWPPATDPAWVLQSGYSKSPNLINDSNSVVRMDKQAQSSALTALEFFQSKTKLASGGSLKRTVPAMVSSGEAYIPPETAKKIGYSKLNRMNQADRNGMRGFSGGGISVFNGPGSGTSDSIGPVGLPEGSYVIRAKATKALGLNKGGIVGSSIKKFAGGGMSRSQIEERFQIDRNINIDQLKKAADQAGMSIVEFAKALINARDTAKQTALDQGKSLEQAAEAGRQAAAKFAGIELDPNVISPKQRKAIDRGVLTEKEAREANVGNLANQESSLIQLLGSSSGINRNIEENKQITSTSIDPRDILEMATQARSDAATKVYESSVRVGEENPINRTRAVMKAAGSSVTGDILRQTIGNKALTAADLNNALKGLASRRQELQSKKDTGDNSFDSSAMVELDMLNQLAPQIEAKLQDVLSSAIQNTDVAASAPPDKPKPVGSINTKDQAINAQNELDIRRKDFTAQTSDLQTRQREAASPIESAIIQKQIDSLATEFATYETEFNTAKTKYLEGFDNLTQTINDSRQAEVKAKEDRDKAYQELVTAAQNQTANWNNLSTEEQTAKVDELKRGSSGDAVRDAESRLAQASSVRTEAETKKAAEYGDATSRQDVEKSVDAGTTSGVLKAAETAAAARAAASIKVADAEKYMALMAQQSGKTLSQYTKQLKQDIGSTFMKLKEEVPKAVGAARANIIQSRDKLTGTDEKERDSAKEGIKSSLRSAIGSAEVSGVDTAKLDAMVNQLATKLQDASVSYEEAIASVDGLQQALTEANSAERLKARAVEEVAAASGVAKEKLGELGDEAIKAAQNMDSNKKFSDKLQKAALVVAALGSAAEFAIKELGGTESKGGAVASAVVGNATQTVGAGAALAKQALTSLPPPFNLFAAAAVAIGTAAVTIAGAFKDAHNAAREFDKALASKNVENSMDRVARAFDDFEKNIKNLNLLDTIQQELTFAGQNVAEGIRIDAEVPKAFWVNMFDALSGGSEAAQRSQILEKKGFGAYMESSAFGQNPLGMMANATLGGIPDAAYQAATGGESMFKGSMDQADINRNNIMASMAPQMAKEQSAQFKPVAEQTLRLFESKLKTGTSMEDVMKELKDSSGAPTQLAENIARSNTAVQEQILNIRASNSLGPEEKRVAEQNIIAEEAAYRTTLELNNALRQLEMDKLDKAIKGMTVSLERMFNQMDQAIGKVSFELDSLTRSAELSSLALSGQAQAGQVSLKSINVLQNQRAYSDTENNMAATQGAEMFGSQAKTIAPLLGLGNKLEDTVLSTINRVRKDSPDASNEKIATNIRFELNKSLNGLGLPSNITDKLSKEVGRAFSDITAKGDTELSFDEIVERVPGFAKAIDSARRAQEMANKALEFWQKNLNDYAQAMNTNVGLQIEANANFRKAASIQYQGQLELKKAFGKSISLDESRKAATMDIKSQTGGLTDPRDIGRNINRLEDTRRSQQALSDSAANRGSSGRNEFMVMQNNLGRTNLALRENYAALKQLADSGELAGAALSKINEIQQKRQAGANVIEKLATSNPEELNNFRNAMARMQNNMAGNVNAGSTSEQRSESLQAFNMIAPMLGDQQGAMRANMLEAMLKESNVGIDPMMQEVLDSLRDPEGDPQMAEAIATYREGVALQTEANRVLGELNQSIADNNAEVAAKKLATAIAGVKLSFESQTLSDINLGIQALVSIAKEKGVPGVAAGKSRGGVVYASAGELINFQPKGTDTVPAMLTPGEFVINRAATQKHLPLLKNINSGNYSSGGKVKYYEDGGLVGYWAERGGWYTNTNANKAKSSNRDNNLETTEKDFIQFKDINNVNENAFSPSTPLYKVPNAAYAVGRGENPIELGSIKSSFGVGNESFIQREGILLNNFTGTTPAGPNFRKTLKPFISIPDLDKISKEIDINSKKALSKNQTDVYLNLINKILDKWTNISDQKTKNLMPESPLTPPELTPKITSQKTLNDGDEYKVSGLSKIDNSSGFLVDNLSSVIPNRGGEVSNIVGWQKGYFSGTKKLASGLSNIDDPNWTLEDVIPFDPIFTRAKTYLYPKLATINQLKLDFENYKKNLKKYIGSGDSSFSESERLSQTKLDFTNLDALYKKRIFKTTITDSVGSVLHNNTITDWPVTLYNIPEDWFSNTVPKLKEAFPGGAGKSYSATADQLLSLLPYNIDTNKQVGGGAKSFAWTSAQTSRSPLLEKQLASAQASFSDNNAPPIKVVAQAKTDDPRFQFSYSEVEAPLFDPNSRNLGNDINKYIMISAAKGSEATNPFSLIPENKKIYAQNIDSVIEMLNNNMPNGEELQKRIDSGEDMKNLAFSFPLTGDNLGLSFIPSDALNLFKTTSIGQSLGDNINFLAPGSGTKPTLENFTLSGELTKAYTQARLDRIKKRGSEISQIKTEKAEGFDKIKDVKTDFEVEEVRIAIAKVAQRLALKEFQNANLPVSLKDPNSLADVGGLASGIFSIQPKFDNRGASYLLLDSWRGIFSTLYKPDNAQKESLYFKSSGIDLSSAAAAASTAESGLSDLIRREKTIRQAKNSNVSTALTSQQKESLEFEGGKLYTIGADGKKTETSPEARESPTTVAQVEKIALVPENIFPEQKTRQNYLDVLIDYYNKAKLSDAAKSAMALKTWYGAQDNYLNTSLSPEQLSSNIPKVEQDITLNDRDSFQKSHFLLAGQKYGELPTIPKIVELIKVRAEEKAKEPEKKETSAGADIANNYATGGLVYASKGKLINFQPRGTDTVPAMLTPGEFVINRESTNKYKPVLEAINSGNYNQGGIVKYLNNGGIVFPNYYQDAGNVSGRNASFDFAGFMQNLTGKLISTIPEAIKQAFSGSSTTTQTTTNGVSSIDSGALDKLNQFTNRLKSVADTLAGLQAIPSEINITGKHDLNIIINGDSALNQLKPDLQNIVLSKMRDAFKSLIDKNTQSGGLLKNMPDLI
jgi:hypothetical protein